MKLELEVDGKGLGLMKMLDEVGAVGAVGWGEGKKGKEERRRGRRGKWENLKDGVGQARSERRKLDGQALGNRVPYRKEPGMVCCEAASQRGRHLLVNAMPSSASAETTPGNDTRCPATQTTLSHPRTGLITTVAINAAGAGSLAIFSSPPPRSHASGTILQPFLGDGGTQKGLADRYGSVLRDGSFLSLSRRKLVPAYVVSPLSTAACTPSHRAFLLNSKTLLLQVTIAQGQKWHQRTGSCLGLRTSCREMHDYNHVYSPQDWHYNQAPSTCNGYSTCMSGSCYGFNIIPSKQVSGISGFWHNKSFPSPVFKRGLAQVDR
ncbi:predicted protein [Histoplasma capsulatum G186AR]|uniref:Uncharacterized protein n=2 Tax=Ajellomyces capsulatus TaxID=5037 RepID=C0NW66_AJECG|nr:uncharacterized protein HCBG_07396 [Histoplasma capsulatum G186AR]EEH04171.1 predicted protein [Histoplasma capsulatum G186AR]KAG5291121.1 hypothetical protein I7I52_08350 [Histoplasma capsulatum]QSS68424.1 hypothetical protein I7I50_07834 [Histoplasma capsulatum G186AR]